MVAWMWKEVKEAAYMVGSIQKISIPAGVCAAVWTEGGKHHDA